MHASRTISLLTVGCMLWCGCVKDHASEFGGSYNQGCTPVTGISTTDVNGQHVHPEDPNDWRTVEDWCPEVEALFAGRPAALYIFQPLDNAVIIGYPNPCEDLFVVHLGSWDSTYVDLRIVDDAYNPLLAVDSITSSQILIATDSLGGSNGQLVRVYYRIVHPDGTAHRGHGDMQLVP